jgi:hypothetical protein
MSLIMTAFWVILTLAYFLAWMMRAKETKLVVSSAKPTFVPEIDCEVFMTRIFEQRLADAGVISQDDITTCSHHKCRDCSLDREHNARLRLANRLVDSAITINAGSITADRVYFPKPKQGAMVLPPNGHTVEYYDPNTLTSVVMNANGEVIRRMG